MAEEKKERKREKAEKGTERARQKSGAYTHLTHEFPPFYESDSRILILGSFPSVKSREQQFYYGHKQNRFWKLLAGIVWVKEQMEYSDPEGQRKEELFNRIDFSKIEIPQTVEDRKEFLRRNRIALWDVIDSCDIIGSSDSSIRNAEVTDLNRILDACEIRQIYTNGAAAYRLFQKYQKEVCGRDAVALPSTSPANAAFSIERLMEDWKCILSELL